MSVTLLLMKVPFSSKGSHSTQLVAGLIVFLSMTLTLAAIAREVVNGQPLTLVDAQLTTWLHTNRSRHLTTAFWILTALGSTELASCIAVGAGLYLLRRRQPDWATAIWLSVFGGMLLNRLLKYLFHRPRPHFDDPILSLTSYSFPSGHTMTATVLYGVLAAYFVSTTASSGKRVLVVLSAGLLIALVGFSRIYLGAHYLSDVLAAIAEGLAWLSLCLTVVYSIWRKRNPAQMRR